jgi:Mrp family chromosome partitioning ATPase
LRQGGVSTPEELESAKPARLDVVLEETAGESPRPKFNSSAESAANEPDDGRYEPITSPASVNTVRSQPGMEHSQTDRGAVPERNGKEPAQTAAVQLDALELAGAGLSTEIGDSFASRVFRSEDRNEEPESATRSVPDEVAKKHPGPDFEPTLHIDSVSWPRPSRRLRHVAGDQIERLAEAVCKAAESGSKLIGVAGFSHGEGCTTVLLALAQRLVELGQATLVLDGDVVKPSLPEHLALANDQGWRDVALGSAALEDVVTQSDSESLGLLPYCGKTTRMDASEPSEESVTAFLKQVRDHYDVIFVDLGGSLTHGGSEGALAGRLAEQVDSVLTVQNVRTTSPSHLAMLRQHFRRLGVAETGIIENFVD